MKSPLEIEKSSLVMAIKLIQVDSSNAPVTNHNLKDDVGNTEVGKNKSKTKRERRKAAQKLLGNTTPDMILSRKMALLSKIHYLERITKR